MAVIATRMASGNDGQDAIAAARAAFSVSVAGLVAGIGFGVFVSI